jgi:hypothetical protein
MKGIIGFIVVILFLIIVWSRHSNDCESWIKENETDLAYNGVITSKFLDANEKNQPWVVLDDGRKYRLQNQDIFNQIRKGDFLFKNKGSLKRYLIKEKDTIVFYSQCGDGNDVK